MSKEDFKTPELFELSVWQALVRTDEWKVYLDLLKSHRDTMNKEALKCVAKSDFHNAVRYEAKAEDTVSLINLVEKRIQDLKNPEE